MAESYERSTSGSREFLQLSNEGIMEVKPVDNLEYDSKINMYFDCDLVP